MAFALFDRLVSAGVNFIDTAEDQAIPERPRISNLERDGPRRQTKRFKSSISRARVVDGSPEYYRANRQRDERPTTERPD